MVNIKFIFLGAVTCSSKDASNAADLLAKQKEPVRTILRITLEQYKIGEEHVGKVCHFFYFTICFCFTYIRVIQ